MDVYLWEASVDVVAADGTSQTFRAGRESTTSDGQSGLPLTTYTDRFIHIRGQVSDFAIDTTGTLEYWVQDAHMTASPGSLGLSGADGAVHLGEKTFALRSAEVDIRAPELVLEIAAPRAGETDGTLRASGEFTEVSINGRLITVRSPVPIAPAAGGVALASFFALAAGAFVHLKVFPLFPGLFRRAARKHGGVPVLNAIHNPTRRRILDLIQEKPGIQPFHIWKAVGGAFGVTIRALEILERLNLVRSIKIGRNKHYYESSPRFEGREAELMAILATRTMGETFDVIRDRPGLTQRELAAALEVSVSTMCERLKRLEQAGLIRVEKKGRTAHYAPATESFRSGAGGIEADPSQAWIPASQPLLAAGIVLPPSH